MLLSPGHSPRQISQSPSTPSGKTLTLTLDPPSSSAAASNPRKRRAAAVLDEDTYVAAIERIIERDFFPDIPKLRDRLDWLEAVRSRDPVVIRDAQLKILERRAGKTPSFPSTGNRSVTETPNSTFLPSFSATPFASGKTPQPPSAADLAPTSDVPDAVDTSLPLDEFFRRYTSEDNESFVKIVNKVNRKQRERIAHLLEGEQVMSIEDKARDRITDGFGTSDQPVSTLDFSKFTVKNLLMYVLGEDAPLTDEERAERIKGTTKVIERSNTRFHGKSAENSKFANEDEAVKILYNPIPGTTPGGIASIFADREAERLRKYDLDDLRKTPNPFYIESAKKSEDGYSFVKTPSPAPGVDESPFMTWGEIEGTPLRLDLEDSQIDLSGSGKGPHFTIPQPPPRDLKAHSLSRDAARKLRQRSKMFQKPPLPSPARGGSASPSMRTLSPAAQKFMRNAIAKSSNSVDESLRASYRGASPVVGTPKTRFSRDRSLGSRSPSTSHVPSPPW